jgi:hypothetical protein
MADRVTQAQLRTRAENLNRRMAHRGAGVRYVVSRRSPHSTVSTSYRKSSRTGSPWKASADGS